MKEDTSVPPCTRHGFECPFADKQVRFRAKQLAYRVNNRTIEIGVRMAVGAQRGQVVWMVLRDSLVLTAIGVLIGVPLASFTARALTPALYGLKPYDGLSYLLAVCGVALVAIVASLIPARRAANVDPLRALRSE